MRRWFSVWVAGRLSAFARSFAVAYASPDDGAALPPCRRDPYALHPNPRYIGFVPAPDDAPRCPLCMEAGS